MTLPMPTRETDALPGHWLVARLGKRVLRPGGVAMTQHLLEDVSISGQDVVELAPGMGRTAQAILDRSPQSYTGVEGDPQATQIVQQIVGHRGTVVHGQAQQTGLPSESADVVIGEAMLTMQTNANKLDIMREAFRILRPGGRYGIHELYLHPDDLADDLRHDICTSIARSIKVNARPITEKEWVALLRDAGFRIYKVRFAPMALLEPSRLIADEGLWGALRFMGNVMIHPQARTRVLTMRSVFSRYSSHLSAIAIVAQKPRH